MISTTNDKSLRLHRGPATTGERNVRDKSYFGVTTSFPSLQYIAWFTQIQHTNDIIARRSKVIR
jgi:hypothetical protein